MTRRVFYHSSFALLFLSVCLAWGTTFVTHSQTPQANRGVIRLKVKFKSGDATKELARKRFFLIKGSLDENGSLIDNIKQAEVMCANVTTAVKARATR